ncbi:MAG: hypothetical protein B6U73_04330, partial [Desulfurococcales archaeon ex4484_204]
TVMSTISRFRELRGRWEPGFDIAQKPLHAIATYGAYKLSGLSPTVLLDYIHHAVFLAAVVFLLWLVVRDLFGRYVAGISALLASTSYLVAGFRVGGFYANEVSLTLYLLITYLLINIGRDTSLKAFLAIALGLAMLLVHPWSGLLYTSSLIPLALTLHLRGGGRRLLAVRALVPLVTIALAIGLAVGVLGVRRLYVLYYLYYQRVAGFHRLLGALREEPLTTYLAYLTTNAVHHYCWCSLCTPLTYLPALASVYDPLTLSLAIPASIVALSGGLEVYFRVCLLLPALITSAVTYARLGSKAFTWLAIAAGLSNTAYVVMGVIT